MTCARALRSLRVLVLAGASTVVGSAGSGDARARADRATTSAASAVSTGGFHTCAVTSAGGVKCWGDNEEGQVADGTTTERDSPVDVAGLTSGVAAVAAGRLHTCALTSAGGVKCWGDNEYGQLGDGTTLDRHTPVDVSGFPNGVAAVGAGGSHTCALTASGGVKCWGDNEYGQLGDGTTVDRNTPVSVSGFTSGVGAVAAGGFHTCALTASGGVECWGSNAYGGLGDGTTTDRYTPLDVFGLTSGVAAVAAGDFYTCALTTSQGVQCWGSNAHGELGDGTTEERHAPIDVRGLANGVTAVTVGQEHTCALTSVGGVKCWGYNDFGQLGDGTMKERHTPVNVRGLTRGVIAIAAGVDHTCALTSAGGVKCWGDNHDGQIGDNDACGTRCATPVQVPGFGRAQCVVPMVMGKKLAAAKQAITQAHCSAGTVREVYSKRVKKGRVVSQTPKSGMTLPPASQVALAVSAPAAASSVPAGAPAGVTARVVTTKSKIGMLAADGGRVAIGSATPANTPCVALWEPPIARVETFDESACEEIDNSALDVVALAGRRLGWIASMQTLHYDVGFVTATATRPKPVGVYGDLDSAGHGGMRGSGNLLVFSRYTNVASELWRIVGNHARKIVTIQGRTDVLDVAQERIVVRHGGVVDVRDSTGRVLRQLGVRASAAELDGGLLVAERGRSLVAYRLATGRPLRVVPLRGAKPRLRGLARGIAVYVAGTDVRLVRIADGMTARALHGLVDAQLTPAGLFYSSSAGAGGRVAFEPFAAVLRRLA